MRRIEPSKSWKAKHFADDNIIMILISLWWYHKVLKLLIWIYHITIYSLQNRILNTDNTIIMRHRLQYHRSSRMHLSSKYRCDNILGIWFTHEKSMATRVCSFLYFKLYTKHFIGSIWSGYNCGFDQWGLNPFVPQGLAFCPPCFFLPAMPWIGNAIIEAAIHHDWESISEYLHLPYLQTRWIIPQ